MCVSDIKNYLVEWLIFIRLYKMNVIITTCFIVSLFYQPKCPCNQRYWLYFCTWWTPHGLFFFYDCMLLLAQTLHGPDGLYIAWFFYDRMPLLAPTRTWWDDYQLALYKWTQSRGDERSDANSCHDCICLDLNPRHWARVQRSNHSTIPASTLWNERSLSLVFWRVWIDIN